MTPDKAMPVVLTLETIGTPLGGLLLVADGEDLLRAVDFADCEMRLRRLLDHRLGRVGYELVPGAVPTGMKLALTAYFAGDINAIQSITLRTGGTPFQNEVWTALRLIEPGRPLPYSALAERLGRTGAARAVGHANGANPFCIVVPCHRLVGVGGSLTGYSGGIERKRWLLDHEAKHA